MFECMLEIYYFIYSALKLHGTSMSWQLYGVVVYNSVTSILMHLMAILKKKGHSSTAIETKAVEENEKSAN